MTTNGTQTSGGWWTESLPEECHLHCLTQISLASLAARTQEVKFDKENNLSMHSRARQQVRFHTFTGEGCSFLMETVFSLWCFELLCLCFFTLPLGKRLFISNTGSHGWSSILTTLPHLETLNQPYKTTTLDYMYLYLAFNLLCMMMVVLWLLRRRA